MDSGHDRKLCVRLLKQLLNFSVSSAVSLIYVFLDLGFDVLFKDHAADT